MNRSSWGPEPSTSRPLWMWQRITEWSTTWWNRKRTPAPLRCSLQSPTPDTWRPSISDRGVRKHADASGYAAVSYASLTESFRNRSFFFCSGNQRIRERLYFNGLRSEEHTSELQSRGHLV